MHRVNILWTGGWDSTFRVLQLMDKEVIIQPYYLKSKRKSHEIEINTIRKLSTQIREHPKSNCQLHDLIIFDIDSLDISLHVKESYERLKNKKFFGAQYIALFELSQKIPDIELSIHKNDPAYGVIKKYGVIEMKYEPAIGDYYKINMDKSNPDLFLFAGYRLPLLQYTKQDMKDWAIANSLIDILEQTWFCHEPQEGEKPCGKCPSCLYTINEGLRWRFDDEALKNFRVRYFILNLKRSKAYKPMAKVYNLYKYIYNNCNHIFTRRR